MGSTLMDSEKRLVLPFKAKGPMSKPDVQLDTVLNDIKDLLKDSRQEPPGGALQVGPRDLPFREVRDDAAGGRCS